MKSLSHFALAAALVTGCGVIVAGTPAAAQEEATTPAFKFSGKEIVAAIGPANTAVNANNPTAAEPLVVQVETLAKNDDDRYAAAELRRAVEVQKTVAGGAQADRTRLVSAYQTLINHARTPQASKASYALDLGIIYYNAKQYPQAVTFFERAKQFGSTEPNLDANIVKAKVLGGDKAGGLAALGASIDQKVAAGQKVPEDQYRFAIAQAVGGRDNAGTLTWMKKYLVAYPTPKNWRDMIKIYGLQQGSLITPSRTQTLDLYRLMRATRSLAGQFDYEDYALKANQSGLPWEARTVLNEGKASGKVPASSTTATQLLGAAGRAITAEGSLAGLETRAKAGADGRLASQTGDAYLGSGNYAKAAELYRAALQKGGANAAEVNTRLGIALAMSGDRAGARTAFQAVTGAPSADIAGLWVAYVDAPPAA